MIDNLISIKKLLEFPDQDTFYYLQVLQRKKDNPEMSWQSKQVYFKFIKSKDDLERYADEAREMSNNYNARTYISLTPRSFEKLSLEVLIELSKRIKSRDFSSTYKLFEKLALKKECIKKSEKLWMIDYDNQEGLFVSDFIKLLASDKYGLHIKDALPTVNGWHLIIKPFNLKCLGEKLDQDYNYSLEGYKFGIKFDCNTLLYYNSKK